MNKKELAAEYLEADRRGLKSVQFTTEDRVGPDGPRKHYVCEVGLGKDDLRIAALSPRSYLDALNRITRTAEKLGGQP